MTTAAQTQIPGYIAGTWDIDPVHSEVSFSVRHMMVSKVRGKFTAFSGAITTADDITASGVQVEIDATSIDTSNAQRDGHVRSADFFDVENHPTWAFSSTSVRADGGELVVDGDLTIKGITRPVTLDVEVGGFGPDAYGGTRAGFTATTSINRSDYGVDIAMPLDGGGVVVSEKVQITLEIQGVLRTA
ncbi:YceI family protein [Pseudonocardia abyssalis]|jgi:polyisoprenoid-binding protein YceI|uniref:YceI family protein n=1 Tax=Pseudonocardia abyssalis TaxID=2792008 RepID=A0ABS6UPH8_9PSEU|nr:YceI family protein [Pseudonocardia abyssalis]MBW0118555.1 YceI family protein [Pseudonocardia abyssalis]MBW0134163.1 YceI family protein [Pseudonocardia abyssalis]